MRAYWPYNLTEGFVDAVTLWSECLKGDREPQEWGVAAAARFLNDAGFGAFAQAIPQDTLRKLRVLVAGAAEFSSSSIGTKNVKNVAAFEALARDVSLFFESNCEVRLEPDLGSADFTQRDWLDADADTLEDVTKVIKNEYDDPGSALDAVDRQAKNLYDTVTPDAANDYSKVPAEFVQREFPKNEYDVIGRDLINSPYMEPPPPESYYEAIQPDGAP